MSEFKDPFGVDLESEIAGMDASQIDEFQSGMSFEHFIVLQKKDVANFCRIVEPLTKASIDEYGKSVYFHSENPNVVSLSFIDRPEYIFARFDNKSGKTIRDFAVSVSTLKKVVTAAFASIVLVEQDNDINISLCGTLVYLETRQLSADHYNVEEKPTSKVVDKNLASYTFRQIGSILSCTESAAEKTIVVKNGEVHFNTAVFTSKSKSPFDDNTAFTIPARTTSILATLTDICKNNLNYDFAKDPSTNQNILVLRCDGVFYCETFIGGEDSVEKFLSPIAEQILNFDANITVINDTFIQLITMVKAMDYLSDIVTLEFTKDSMSLIISTKDHNKNTTIPFNISSGAPEVEGKMNIGVDVLKVFLNLIGKECTYAFNNYGLGVHNATGAYLIRKAS